MSGLTIALLLATALASLPTTTEGAGGAGRIVDRAGRTAIQPELLAGAGFELVAFATMATIDCPAWLHPAAEAQAATDVVDGVPAIRSTDVAAGLMNLPPPIRA